MITIGRREERETKEEHGRKCIKMRNSDNNVENIRTFINEGEKKENRGRTEGEKRDNRWRTD